MALESAAVGLLAALRRGKIGCDRKQYGHCLVPEIKPLTSLRGIAAFGVLLFHIDAGVPHFGELFAKGYLWVDMFFVLSGFVISYAYAARVETWQEYRQFLRARFARIYPLHVAVLCLAIGIELGRWAMIAHGYPASRAPFAGTRAWQGLPSEFLMLQGIGPFGTETWNVPAWSISVEFLAYLAFPLLLDCAQTRPKLLLFAVLIGIAAWPLVNAHAAFYAAPLRCIAEFALGMLTHRIYRHGAFAAIRDGCAAVCGIGIMALLWIGAPDQVFAPLFAFLILACAQSTGIARSLLSCTPLVYLGEISFALYMTQQPFAIEQTDMLTRALHIPFPSAWIVMLVALGVAVVAHHLIEAPARVWIKGLSPHPVGRVGGRVDQDRVSG